MFLFVSLFFYRITRKKSVPTVFTKREIDQLLSNGPECQFNIYTKIWQLIYNNGAKLNQFHPIYQRLYAQNAVLGDICNGGFCQYYGNSTAEEFQQQGLEGLKMIGAHKTAALITKVWDTILNQSPFFRDQYEVLGIQDAFNIANDEYEQIEIDAFDDQFFGLIREEENMEQLTFTYIKKVAAAGWME